MKYLITTYLIFSISFLMAQTQKKLKIEGITTNGETINTSTLKNVTINIYEYNDKIASYESNLKGQFEFEIDMNSYIMLEFLKEGFLTKRILFDTRNKNIDYGKNYIPFNFEIVMLLKVEGIDADDIDFPITKVEYFPEEKEFLFVEKYTNDMIKLQEKIINKRTKEH
ncbi:MAG TPA: hypothetical protein PK833_09550 [Vicingus sp.]|nr:hypothetical protein [Vicingus sp.]